MKNWQQHLNKLYAEGLHSLYPDKIKITIGQATCGRASGSEKVYDALVDELRQCAAENKAIVSSTGCLGFCQQEPLVYLQQPGKPRYVYGKFDVKLARELVQAVMAGQSYEKQLLGIVTDDENIVEDVTFPLAQEQSVKCLPPLKEHPFYKGQMKIAMRNCGIIDPFRIEEYVSRGGYQALQQALQGGYQQVIDTVKSSGLRGRGGGGFPTGLKWEYARKSENNRKYLICNADEGDPGAYMDRSVLESDPHSVIEGMVIGGFAIGANTGIIYCRAEYPLAVETISHAIKQAEANGFLGENIFNSGFNFDIKVVKGAGAFVCGEETALITSIEGKLGEPRPRPPFPAQKGLWGYPTVINNVETWANIPPILCRGSDWYAGIGTENSRGTKVFALVGDVRNNGLVEVPMGTTIRQIVYDIGGGAEKKLGVKAVQTGGPSGGCIPASLFDTPVDYQRLAEIGAIMGSGGMVVMNERSCMVDVARFFMQFTQHESCGKCVPCREGTRRMLTMLDDICEGRESNLESLKLLEELALVVKESSLCGLGQTAPNPILSTLKHFRPEYESHIREHYCPSGVCKELFEYEIDHKLCVGCGLCAKACPQGAISGVKKQAFTINQSKCIKCRICYQTCSVKAVKAVKAASKE